MQSYRPFLALLLALGSSYIAKANLVIDAVYGSSITSDANSAAIESSIQSAINTLEADLANPVTVTIDFDETNYGLGSSSTYEGTTTYSSYLTRLSTAQTLSAQDVSNIASFNVARANSNPADNPVNGGSGITLTLPLARALGFSGVNPPAGQPDSTIEFNSSLVYFGTGAVPAGKYSLSSVVAHEMDEVLGTGGAGSMLNDPSSTSVGPLDLDRYSAPGVRSYTTSSSATSYFSIDGGATKLVYFNQAGSSGSDFGDWGNGVTAGAGNNPPKVQDAYGTPGSDPVLGPDELTALDVVGWNLTTQGSLLEAQAVPEPSILYLLAAGALLLGAGVRHFRSARS